VLLVFLFAFIVSAPFLFITQIIDEYTDIQRTIRTFSHQQILELERLVHEDFASEFSDVHAWYMPSDYEDGEGTWFQPRLIGYVEMALVHIMYTVIFEEFRYFPGDERFLRDFRTATWMFFHFPNDPEFPGQSPFFFARPLMGETFETIVDENISCERTRIIAMNMYHAHRQRQRLENDEANQIIIRETGPLGSRILARLDTEKPFVGGEMLWPVPTANRISSGFGYRGDPFTSVRTYHFGIDIPARPGTEIIAVLPGTVIISAYCRTTFGHHVVIDHGGGIATVYTHNNRNFVQVGDSVEAGDVIAHVGNTGRSTGAHLHFEVRVNGQAVNPTLWVTRP
jgi:hypothetical protein